MDPETANAFNVNRRGFCYGRQQKHLNAIADYKKAIELRPVFSLYYQNLSEAYIVIGDFKSSLNTIQKALPLSVMPSEEAVSIYLKCITRKMLDMDISGCNKEFKKILKEEFNLNWWGFEPIETWLAEAGTGINADKKAFIIEKTEQLKKHKR